MIYKLIINDTAVCNIIDVMLTLTDVSLCFRLIKPSEAEQRSHSNTPHLPQAKDQEMLPHAV